MQLSHSDHEAVYRTIYEMHEHQDSEELRRAIPVLLKKIIPADWVALLDFGLDPAQGTIVPGGVWETDRRVDRNIQERMLRYGWDHPFTRYTSEHQEPQALMMSDFYSLNQFVRTELYNEFYRFADIQRLLAMGSVDRRHVESLNLSRRRCEKAFTERDRQVLQLLQPHIHQARRNAERNEARAASGANPPEAYGLTPREIEVARWLAEGKTNPEIATILHMAARTVEKHVERILEKLAVENRTAAAVLPNHARGRSLAPMGGIGRDARRPP